MRAKDAARLSTLRLLTAAIKQREVDERIELDDAAVVSVVEKMIKQRRESIAQFEKASRTDLAEAEKAEVQVLSVPVTYASLKNKDIDVFLGNWMPSMEGDSRAYFADGSVEVVGANLTGAKYTLAVPAYTQEAGLKDFADIQRFGAALNQAVEFFAELGDLDAPIARFSADQLW